MSERRRTVHERPAKVGWSEIAVAALAFALGAYSVASGRELGYVRFGIPGAGFFPIWIGIALMVAALPLVPRGWRRRHRVETADWGMIAALIGATLALLLATSVVGLVPALFVFAAGTIPILGAVRPLLAVLIAAVATLVIWATFEAWLGIPLPSGLIGD